MSKNNKDKVKIIPLGGLGTIGKNITLIEYNNDIIIIDCGIMFPNEETPGIDFIIPDFSYIFKNRDRVKAIVVTHGHEDHIGAIPFLLQKISIPIYATKLTIGLIQSRLLERPPINEPEFIEIKPRDIVNIASFTIEFIRVTHSIVDGVGLAIQTGPGTIIHTGDFKIDFSPVDGDVTDIYRFSEYGEKGVLLLMSDSTNAEKVGFTKSESILDDRLIDIFSTSKGRIIVASFASNINRIQQILDIAKRYHRKVVLTGFSMIKNVEISRTLGYLNIKDDILVSLEEANQLPDKKLVIIGTGSQGEPMSAIYRMANGLHRHFTAQKGDTVIITASVIPGNERLVTNVINLLMQLGAEVYYNKDSDIHVSGHGSAKELKLMISMTRPKYFMPIHGEFKHLKAHARIAESLKIKSSRILIPQNGDVLELSSKFFGKKDSINLSQIYVDGSEIGDVDSGIIKERQTMSTDGIIIATILISEGMLIMKPEIAAKGFLGARSSHVLGKISETVEEKVCKMLKDDLSVNEIRIKIKNELKNIVYKLSKRNSLVEVQVFEI